MAGRLLFPVMIMILAAARFPCPPLHAQTLEAEVRLSLDRVRPGRPVQAQAFLTNTGDEPVQVTAFTDAAGGFDVRREGLPVARCLTECGPEEGSGAFTGKFTVAPGRTILLRVLPLHEAFDIAREGPYEIRFAYGIAPDSRVASAGSRGIVPDRPLGAQGFWTGRVESPPVALVVDRTAPLHPAGLMRKVEARITAVDADGSYAIDDRGERSAYPGLVFTAVRDGRTLGTLRFGLVRGKTGERLEKRLFPADMHENLHEGDSVEAYVDRSRTMRSEPVPDQGAGMNGLELELEMEETTLVRGATWVGSILLANRGARAETFDPGSGLMLNLYPVDGPTPRVTSSMGAGFGVELEEMKRNCVTLKPGWRHEIVRFNYSDRKSQFGAMFGRWAMSFDFEPGTYRLSFTYVRDAASLAGLDMPFVWTGAIRSNAVTVVVVDKAGQEAGRTVNGLQLVLRSRSSKDRIDGGVELKNAGQSAIRVDLRGRMTVEFRTPGGELVCRLHCQNPMIQDPSRAGELVASLNPGQVVEFASFYAFENCLLGPDGEPLSVAPGAYIAEAVFTSALPGNGSAEGDPEPWSGTVRSNRIRLKIPGEREN